MRTTKRRLLSAVLVAGATALATLAVAQPRTKPGAGRPKAPAAKPDAQAPPSTPPPAAPEETAAVDAGAAATPPPAPSPEVGDGGLRASPLNPEPQEMPGTADAGVPIDYDRLLADIAALRARVAAVSDNLYQSRVAIRLQTEGDHGKIARLAVSLDDGVVFTAPASFAAGDMTTVYDHALAPGRHAVTIDVDRKDDRDEGFRTSQRSRFMVEVPRDHRLGVEVRIIDDSAMGADFASDKSGKYDLRIRVKAVAKPVGK